MATLNFAELPQYYSCPVCGEVRSLTRKAPQLVLIAAQVLGVCPECYDKLENDEPLEAPSFQGFGLKKSPDHMCDPHGVNAVSDMSIEYEDGE